MSSEHRVLLPGATLGMIGGGQLGRYFVLEARRLGYRTWVVDPDATAPAMQLADHPLVAAYDDPAALAALVDNCQAVTIEFENVPAAALERLAGSVRVMPPPGCVAIAQHRLREKQAATQFGLRPVPHAGIEGAGDVAAALDAVALPAILKTSRLGYDGKGQQTCRTAAEVMAAFREFGEQPCVLEQRIELAAEVSVVLARGLDGDCAVFPVAQNTHVDGVLHTSVVPADVPAEQQAAATRQALALAQGLDYRGVLAIEFFIDTAGTLYFNEMAPRPHNSGHYTLDAVACSQFEQQLRALCALPFGSTRLHAPVAMLNLLGDRWLPDPPDWSRLFALPDAALHLYGKQEARAGRKMGHVNCLAESAEQAAAQALQLAADLR